MTENCYWDALATHEFLVLLEDRAKTSHGTSMKNADYKIFSDKRFEKIGRRYQPSQLLSKYHRLCNTYNSWRALMQHTGFGWDLESQTPICPEEIWQEYLQQNKGANEFVKKGLVDSHLYEVIFEKQHATGRFAHTSASQPAGYHVHVQDTIGVNIDDDEFEPDLDKTTGEKRSNTTRCSRYVDKKKNKKVHEHPLSPVISRLTDVIVDKSMSASVRPRYSGQGSEENTSALDDPCSMVKCYDILINMQLEPKLVMKIVTGWEGSAYDSRILNSVLDNPNSSFPHPPQGKYYFVDAGYANKTGFLSPHRRIPYHVADRRRNQSGPRELFNYRNASLRNVIKRTFGVLKKRFRILEGMNNYSLEKQAKITMTYFILHNFIRLFDM